ncbi:MAG: protoporphyrinogen oxidase HemJ [Rhizobiales bacterium]|nr:protoporphyrinogen oxidase HemJ [Hyphomicrobiales bacterium]
MNAYLWLKAVHLIAVISWMAALLYLPRLFVYHCDAKPGSEMSETFKVMERRLLRAIMTPAMIAAWILGLCLAWVSGLDYLTGTAWFWLKLALVVGLTACHGVLARHVKAFAADQNDKSPRYFRIINEVPTVLMIGIVILVVVKAF